MEKQPKYFIRDIDNCSGAAGSMAKIPEFYEKKLLSNYEIINR